MSEPSDRQSWAVRHFSQANPQGDGQGNVPALLRAVADTIEGLEPVDIQDIAFHAEVTADGDWVSMTVYFHESPPNSHA